MAEAGVQGDIKKAGCSLGGGSAGAPPRLEADRIIQQFRAFQAPARYPSRLSSTSGDVVMYDQVIVDVANRREDLARCPSSYVSSALNQLW